MTALAVLMAATAAWWTLPRRAGPVLPARRRPGTPRAAALAPAVALGVGVVAAAGLLGGRTAGVLAAAACVVAGGLAVVVRGRWRTRDRERRADEVARACTALAQELSVGRVPAAALASAADDFAVLRPAAAVVAVGGEVVPVWESAAARPGAEGLGRLGRAWHVAEVTGAPLAATLEAVAERLRADREVAAIVNAELATARLTGRILTVLPVAGLGLGFLIGGDPLAFLVGHPVGQACLLAGVVLATGGLVWTERLGEAR